MKILLFIFSIIYTSLAYTANCQSVVSINSNPKAGFENYFEYRPEKGLQVPDSIQISALYLHDQDFHIKTILAEKLDNRYTFPLSVPDSTSMMILCVTEVAPLSKFDFSVETSSIIDNNKGLGFLISFYDKEGNSFDFENIDKATLLYHFAPHYLKLKEIPKSQLMNSYEDSYQKYPDLKKSFDFDFHNYLDLLFREKGETVKPILVEYAKSVEKMKQSERKWIWAAQTYNILGMQNEESRVENEIITAYPTGDIAKKDFWRKFYSTGRLSISDIKLWMRDYISKFNDTSSISKDKFYIQSISLFLQKKMWDSLLTFEPLISNKIYLSNIYNNFALHLYSEPIDTSKHYLQIARTLSRKAIYFTKNRIIHPVADDYSNRELQSLLNKFYDSYAQILFKLGYSDSAFYYQDAIYKQSVQLNQKQIERYVLYSEKARGMKYTRQVIEDQLLKGIWSDFLFEQLHSFYKKMGLSVDKFKIIREKSLELALEKNKIEIRNLLGTTTAKNFNLKNILGQTASLSSLKGKVVLVDFWATWCAPCLAAFPMMQEMVNKYRNDKAVNFLFVNILEHTTFEKMKLNAVKLMKDGNYNFNVLLDTVGETVTNYRIESIPLQIIIEGFGICFLVL